MFDFPRKKRLFSDRDRFSSSSFTASSSSYTASSSSTTTTNGGEDQGQQVVNRQQQQQQQQQQQHRSSIEKKPELKEYYQHDKSFNPRKVDDLLIKEMMSLSFEDRNNISEEVHGVRCLARDESPDLIARSLQELEREIRNLPASKKRAYTLASTLQEKSYVNSCDFKLRFLRCELFNAAKAAQRLIKYLDLLTYQLKLKNDTHHYYPTTNGHGNENGNGHGHNSDHDVLQRPVTLSDFNDQEMTIFKSGHFQLLPYRDRSGRKVIAVVSSLGMLFDPEIWFKVVLYTLLIAVDDLESQQKGIVVVLWPDRDIANTIKSRHPIINSSQLYGTIFKAVPVRVSAFHFCTPDTIPFFKVLRSVFVLVVDKVDRSRVKFHTGESVELQYQMSSYGLPVDLLPLTPTGNIKTTYLKQWLKLRKIVEQNITAAITNNTINNRSDDSRKYIADNNNNNNNTIYNYTTVSSSTSSSVTTKNNIITYGLSTMVECPGSLDVLFRPGKPVMNHPGNVAFRSLIESMKDVHDQSSQTQKSEIVKKIVNELIHNRTGRFLAWDDSKVCWTPIVEPRQQRRKVAVAFRNTKSHRKAQLNRQTVTDESDDSTKYPSFEHLDNSNNSSNGGIMGISISCCQQNSSNKRKRPPSLIGSTGGCNCGDISCIVCAETTPWIMDTAA